MCLCEQWCYKITKFVVWFEKIECWLLDFETSICVDWFDCLSSVINLLLKFLVHLYFDSYIIVYGFVFEVRINTINLFWATALMLRTKIKVLLWWIAVIEVWSVLFCLHVRWWVIFMRGVWLDWQLVRLIWIWDSF